MHRPLGFRQGLVDKVDGNGAFTDCRSDALHITGADITHRKYAGEAGFEHLWNAHGLVI